MPASTELAEVQVGPSRVDLGFVPSDGSGYRRLPLRQCWNAPFENTQPVRAFVSYKGQKNFCGLRWVATTGSHVGYESWLERDHLTLLDFGRQVIGVASQPFSLFWHDGRRERRHTPDYFARLVDGSGLVVDVKPERRIKQGDAQAFAVTARACREAGWEYRRVGEFDPVYRANLRWLAAYRHPRHGRWPDGEAVLAQFENPTPLFVGAQAVGTPLVVLPLIYHLMWHQRLTVDLRTAPLHGSSLVSTRCIGAPTRWQASSSLWMPTGAVINPAPRRDSHGRQGDAGVDGSTHVLKVGDRVRWHGSMRTVTHLSGNTLTLIDGHGAAEEVGVAALFADAELTDLARRPARLASGTLALLPEPVLTQARWWEDHVLEVLTGLSPGSDGGNRAPKPEYDPQTRTLGERERSKAEELAAQGHSRVSGGTVRRKRLRYEARGLEGLVDWRNEPKRSARVDERVVAALRQVIEEAVNDSTRTGTYLMWKTQQVLIAEYGEGVVTMPSRATFFRLLANLAQGRHTTGSAKTRRSMASQPRGPYGCTRWCGPVS
ncbi:TnsA-like heteromeric transposase endonuclease subunit [Nocardia sp. 2YAB30]|uniref:TnsA-like heteromeric transposase endonuclease subunit n=1 Tax=Nocardia sp. 2YAB30 TaxID=3233022 RepID=UPI003F9C78C0